jgi:hypothetical protein
MSLQDLRLIAAGKALAQVASPSEVASILVDGKKVDGKRALRACLAAEVAAKKPPPALPDFVERIVGKVERRVGELETKLEGSKLGRPIAKILKLTPERVTARLPVEITLVGGRSQRFEVEVEDRPASRLLARLSMFGAIGGMLPLIGGFAPAGAALVAGIAAIVARVIGEAPLGRACARTAVKELGVTGGDLIPVIGYATAALASAVETQHYRAAPPIATIVELDKQKAA